MIVASTLAVDGRENAPYPDILAMDAEIDLGVAGSDQARELGEHAFRTIRRR